MSWLELRLIGLPRARLDDISGRLFALGASGLQEDVLPGQTVPVQQPWDTGPPAPPPDPLLLRAWFEDPNPAEIDASLAGVPAEMVWAEVAETDWEAAWRAGFVPIRISERLVVAPPWDAPAGALIIEPGQGFGTGSHPTTQMALAAVDDLADGLKTALDVGCGSGVLAIAAARLGLRAEGIDVEESAVRDAVANAERNGVQVAFSTLPAARVTGRYDLVLGNLHAELIATLADDLVRLTGRWLVLAGILEDREQLVYRAIDGRLELSERFTEGAWVSLRFGRAQ